ncbi:carboxymuconolactone decarboxylase family protein [Pelagibius litoralis]|uniref:Carboxymuconolactone decarboxylase family protein n=1 Tax=Pelagibius litoralis TaxID=374515 RepID=A0A967C2K6_9PROT|nr:carboxymuconolactone decarboxylase family protein [Pelagibius litoralis]NIA68438.1 carboxymuconolactone decarboxylase family protein [Pelagibius litoralis]
MLVSPKPLAAYPWFIRLFFRKQKRTYGKVLEPGLLWGRSPWVFAALALLYGALNRRGSPLDPALRSLVTVRISQINHCAFCVDVNAATLEKRGVGEAKILALGHWRTSDLFTPVERAALAYAEAVTHTDGEVTGEIRAALQTQFDEDARAELTGLIAFQNMSSKFNAALDVAPQGFCHVPNLVPGPEGDREVGRDAAGG